MHGDRNVKETALETAQNASVRLTYNSVSLSNTYDLLCRGLDLADILGTSISKAHVGGDKALIPPVQDDLGVTVVCLASDKDMWDLGGFQTREWTVLIHLIIDDANGEVMQERPRDLMGDVK